MTAATPFLLALALAMSSAPPDLTPCPRTPNCVSTQAEDPDKRMAPIPFIGDLDTARTRLLAMLSHESRVEIVETRPDYVHAVFTTLVFRFKDDVEFAFDAEAKVIHFRSASRVGRGDFGTNRRRMERLTSRFLELEILEFEPQ